MATPDVPAAPAAAGPDGPVGPGGPVPGFRVQLTNFDGPFDLLLQLISARQMDVTEVALHKVTDDFIAHIKGLGKDADLGVITEFLLVAATLLDLKAARLLPDAEVEDIEDLALLEARDLLFARLLAYRAYQQVAALFTELEATALRRYPRAVTLEDRYLGLLPEVTLGMDAAAFAELAAAVFRPKPPPTVSLAHIHTSPVSVAEHTAAIRDLLAEHGTLTFDELVAGCEQTLEVVARFLGLLNLFREAAVAFDQPEPLGRLTVRWTGLSDEQTAGALEEEYE
ncbi:segregation and condensation protein A [Nakamurella alba]|uniref:segregation and condensation protein A n=1 Tax=Nakamurella alba TaxID=2665158 RepID=UPI002AC356C8|nr:segregation/condensation protein A [Nakamurella alba]